MTDSNALYNVWLSELKPLRTERKLELLAAFSSAEAVYAASVDEYRDCMLSPEELQALTDKNLDFSRDILAACQKLDQKLLFSTDANFPDLLRNIPDPPLLLYYCGELPDFDSSLSLAIVGSRNASPAACSFTEKLAEDLSQAGVTVISGGARGIDTSALYGALKGNCAPAAVFGSGLDVFYPRENCELFRKVRGNGCLISEFTPGTKPLRWNFPKRNRILSGLCRGIIVAEAAKGSGSLITADFALEQGRDVFSCPGQAGHPRCAGSNLLIKQGAYCVDSAEDILNVYSNDFVFSSTETGPAVSEALPCGLTNQEQAIVALLTQKNAGVDELSAHVGLPVVTVLQTLTFLQIRGIVHPQPGGMWGR